MGFFSGKKRVPPAPKPPQLDLAPLMVRLPPDKRQRIEKLLMPQFHETFPDDEQATWKIIATALQPESASGVPILWVKAEADNFGSPDKVFVWAVVEAGEGVTEQATYSPDGALFSMLCHRPDCVKGLPDPIAWA